MTAGLYYVVAVVRVVLVGRVVLIKVRQKKGKWS